MREAKDLSHKMRMEVLLEASHRCSNPRCFEVVILEAHHIWWVKDGGPNDISNLIALCANCHGKVTKGLYSEEMVRHWKGMLVALNHAVDRKGMDLLLFLRKNPEHPVTGDGLTAYAGVIASGLADSLRFFDVFTHQHDDDVAALDDLPWGQRMLLSYHIENTYLVSLSNRGRMLIDAWLEGDEAAYLRMVMQDENAGVEE